MSQAINKSLEIKVQVPNIAASINDLRLDLRSKSTTDVSQTFKTSDDETATLTVRSNFTNKQRYNPTNEYNKTDIEYNIHGISFQT